MQTPEVLKKSERFAEVLETYRQRYDAGEGNETTMTDLLADAFHWADTVGVDTDLCLARALTHYSAELRGEE